MWAIELYPLDRNFDLQDRLGLGNQLPIPQLHGNATAIRGNGRRGETKKGRRRELPHLAGYPEGEGN